MKKTYLWFLKVKKEIKLVGFRDWCWFVIRLQRNEFHKSLDLWSRQNEYPHFNKMNKLRYRAHRIDDELREGKKDGYKD